MNTEPWDDTRQWADADELIDPDMGDPDDTLDQSVDTDATHSGATTPTLYYPPLDTFVRELLAPTYKRLIDDGRNRTWCPQWWRHAEAIARLEALWRSWEHLRLDPATGISVWFRDHADHHMAVLLDPDGPFKYCTPEKGHSARLAALPLDDPPEGLFQPPTI